MELYTSELVLTNIICRQFQTRYQDKTLEFCIPTHFKLAKDKKDFYQHLIAKFEARLLPFSNPNQLVLVGNLSKLWFLVSVIQMSFAGPTVGDWLSAKNTSKFEMKPLNYILTFPLISEETCFSVCVFLNQFESSSIRALYISSDKHRSLELRAYSREMNIRFTGNSSGEH